MSIIRCSNCSRTIDTDFDAEAFIEELHELRADGTRRLMDVWWCEPCRERKWRDEELPDADRLL